MGLGRSKDRMKFAIISTGMKVEDLKVGDIIEYIHPKYCSFQCQRIHNIKGKTIIMKNAVGEFIRITDKNVRKIRNDLNG